MPKWTVSWTQWESKRASSSSEDLESLTLNGRNHERCWQRCQMNMKHAWLWQKAKNFGNCWNKKGVLILPVLSKEDTLKENLILKKRREVLDERLPAEKLKIRNLELFKEGQNVEINTEGANSDWLGFLNILHIYTRSLIDIDRRMKFSNAVLPSAYNVICLCETWLNENINAKGLLLNDYDIYSKERELDGDINFHGGSLIAVKNSYNSEQIGTPFPDSCLACRIKLNTWEVVICAFYNHRIGSAYRYSVEYYPQLLKNIPKSNPAIVCGDLNFRETNWKASSSSSEEENSIPKIFEEALFRQALEFPTCSENTLDVAFYRNCFFSSSEKRSVFSHFFWLHKPRGSPYHVRMSSHPK